MPASAVLPGGTLRQTTVAHCRSLRVDIGNLPNNVGTMHLDALDRALLELLAANARLPTATIARSLGLSRTTVQSRILRLEKAGIILGYTTRLGPQAPAPRETVSAYVLIAVAPRHAAGVEAALRRMDEVRTLHAVSGGFDLVALVETASLRDADRLLDRIGALAGVERTNSMLILSTRLGRAET